LLFSLCYFFLLISLCRLILILAGLANIRGFWLHMKTKRGKRSSTISIFSVYFSFASQLIVFCQSVNYNNQNISY
jgi:hypothetical protein